MCQLVWITHFIIGRTASFSDKFDTAAIDRATQIGFPSLNPILPELLEWVILPHINAILISEDRLWKYWTIELVVSNLKYDIQIELHDELTRLANYPTYYDKSEEVDVPHVAY